MNLTSDQIKAMQPGSKLDYEVHIRWHPEDVVEWRWCSLECRHDGAVYRDRQNEMTDWSDFKEHGNWKRLPCIKIGPSANNFYRPIPAHSTDGNAMLALKEKMWDAGLKPFTKPSVGGGWIATIWSPIINRVAGEAIALREPEAVAIAAVLAKLPKEGEE